ncbi:TIGR02281 family clan AA aspartic protease [Pontixanthobacter aestiaquae]|uniref:TIGR02281 family clan AA aspartic protease n=1 Tax=Pontixanthobacter aestiaquae TaxID=1509367 RepID=A0A844Z4T9_9SPHN|nr:TIGR02281 family clan AA aspartic protease [Pontixanthobacter aestiaquae]MDN3646498.1 TIGR02281 family clan AA aspartic protease [Pontixanthobacter aestiaquae]MXO82514.1 TIGR02281 family clan AA aspartic protease [Pontixanthobacter aestiaquae]
MYRTLFFSGGLVIAVATMFPKGDEDAAGQIKNGEIRGVDTSDWADSGNRIARNTQSQARNTSGGSSEWYSSGHSLKRQSDGHFYANGTVQGASTEFLVDTGASVIALTGNDARAAGLTWNDADIRPIGTGASGAVYGVATIIDQVEVGGLAQRNVRAVIIPEGLEISLLGQSFLAQIDSVEIVKDKMVWKGS